LIAERKSLSSEDLSFPYHPEDLPPEEWILGDPPEAWSILESKILLA